MDRDRTGQFQIAQRTPITLRVCWAICGRRRPDGVWQAVRSEITHLFTEHKVDNVTLVRAEEPPQPSPGDQYRRIIPLS